MAGIETTCLSFTFFLIDVKCDCGDTCTMEWYLFEIDIAMLCEISFMQWGPPTNFIL